MKLRATGYMVKSERLPKEFNGFKVAVLSDLHDTVYGSNNIELFRRIESEKPDIVLVAGDLITGLADRKFDAAINLLKMLSEKYVVYYGLGNHEVRSHDNTREYVKAIKNIPNIQVLDNSLIKLERINNGCTASITIAGLTLEKSHYSRRNRRAVMEEAFIQDKLGIKTDDFTILLAHHPDYFEHYVSWGADLIFSGHLHGGLVRLPLIGGVLSPQIKLFPKYDKGEFKKNLSTMIVSAGHGTHSVPRIFNPPELLVVELFAIEKS